VIKSREIWNYKDKI